MHIDQYEVVKIKHSYQKGIQYKVGLKLGRVVTEGIVYQEDNRFSPMVNTVNKIHGVSKPRGVNEFERINEVILEWTSQSPQKPTKPADMIRVINIRGKVYRVINEEENSHE